MTRRQALFSWVAGSAALMVLGSFGPWAKVLSSTVSGTDGGNDGWFVGAIAVGAAAVFLWKRETAQAGYAAIVGGVLGSAVVMYDRSNLKDAASGSVQVGWGLNLALIASISLAISGAVWVVKSEEEASPAPTAGEPIESTAPPEQV